MVTGGGDDRAFLWDLNSGEKKAESKAEGEKPSHTQMDVDA